MKSQSAEDIMQQLQPILSEHGVPDVVMSDNDPQLSCQDFKNTASKYRFEHPISSLLYGRVMDS